MKTRFEVTVKAHRKLIAKECAVVARAITDAVREESLNGGLTAEIEVTTPFTLHKNLARDTTIMIQGVRGRVLTATNYGSPEDGDNWYIEMVDDDGHYRYWKQGIDGGTLVIADGN